jgi:hypothetical protein
MFSLLVPAMYYISATIMILLYTSLYLYLVYPFWNTQVDYVPEYSTFFHVHP